MRISKKLTKKISAAVAAAMLAMPAAQIGGLPTAPHAQASVLTSAIGILGLGLKINSQTKYTYAMPKDLSAGILCLATNGDAKSPESGGTGTYACHIIKLGKDSKYLFPAKYVMGKLNYTGSPGSTQVLNLELAYTKVTGYKDGKPLKEDGSVPITITVELKNNYNTTLGDGGDPFGWNKNSNDIYPGGLPDLTPPDGAFEWNNNGTDFDPGKTGWSGGTGGGGFNWPTDTGTETGGGTGTGNGSGTGYDDGHGPCSDGTYFCPEESGNGNGFNWGGDDNGGGFNWGGGDNGGGDNWGGDNGGNNSGGGFNWGGGDNGGSNEGNNPGGGFNWGGGDNGGDNGGNNPGGGFNWGGGDDSDKGNTEGKGGSPSWWIPENGDNGNGGSGGNNPDNNNPGGGFVWGGESGGETGKGNSGTDGLGGEGDNKLDPLDWTDQTRNNSNTPNYGDLIDDMLGDDRNSSYDSPNIDWALSDGASHGGESGDYDLDDYFRGIDYAGDVPDGLTLGDDVDYGYEDGIQNDDAYYGNSEDGDGYPAEPEEGFYANGSGAGSEGQDSGLTDGFDSFAAAYQEALNSLDGSDSGSSDGSNGILGDMDEGGASLKDKLTGLLGREEVSEGKRGTVSDQELYDFAKKYLLNHGYSAADIMKGNNYDVGSAYTEPTAAWDMNRITTLLRGRKVSLTNPTEVQGSSKSGSGALSRMSHDSLTRPSK